MKIELKRPALIVAGAIVFAELVALLFGIDALLVLNLCLAVAWAIQHKVKR